MADCSSLKSITLGGPNPLNLYGNFASGSPVENLHLRGNVKPNIVFANGGLKNIQTVEFTDYCNEIADNTFQYCTGLTEIDFSNIRTIGRSAFADCTGLTAVDLSSIEEIGSFAFDGCTNLKSVKLGNKTTEIPDCFSKTGITSLTIPNNVTSFYAPRYCKQLVSVRIGDGVTQNNGYFSGCDALKSIYYGSSVTSVALNPSSVRTIESANPTPPQASYFSNEVYQNCELIVPFGASDAYKNAMNWKYFYKITEADLTGIESIEADTEMPLLEIVDGLVKINTRSSASIYSLDGKAIRNMPAGQHQIELRSGVYILVSGSSSRKFRI